LPITEANKKTDNEVTQLVKAALGSRSFHALGDFLSKQS
jgi:hypothetical protein